MQQAGFSLNETLPYWHTWRW